MSQTELGIYTFAENTPIAGTGETLSAEQRLSDLMEEIELADQVGLDVFGVGEHHRPEFVVSSLFGEKLALLLQLREETAVTWSGRFRAPIEGRGVYPRPVQQRLPIWIAVGGSPQSVVRAGTLGLPMALAIIGGAPERFVPLVELYRESGRRAGHDPAALKVSVNSHGLIADTSDAAAETAYPPYVEVMGKLGRERGWGAPNRRQFDAERSASGAMLVGDPQQVIEKILFEHELFGNQRFLIQFSVGTIPHATIMRSIELYGTVVAPAVRGALGASATGP